MKRDPEVSSSAFAEHDHHACAGDILDRAVARAEHEGLRLTPVRRRVLEILLSEHRAFGAYEVLEHLADEGYGKQPPVVYRALDFLVDHGFVHRVRRLNAFSACQYLDQEHAPVFLICRECNAVAEAPGPLVRHAVEDVAGPLGFQVERCSVEVLGLCPACQEKLG